MIAGIIIPLVYSLSFSKSEAIYTQQVQALKEVLQIQYLSLLSGDGEIELQNAMKIWHCINYAPQCEVTMSWCTMICFTLVCIQMHLKLILRLGMVLKAAKPLLLYSKPCARLIQKKILSKVENFFAVFWTQLLWPISIPTSRWITSSSILLHLFMTPFWANHFGAQSKWMTTSTNYNGMTCPSI